MIRNILPIRKDRLAEFDRLVSFSDKLIFVKNCCYFLPPTVHNTFDGTRQKESCNDIGGDSVKKSIKLSFFNGSILADRVIKLSSYFLNKNDSAKRNEVKLFSEFL